MLPIAGAAVRVRRVLCVFDSPGLGVARLKAPINTGHNPGQGQVPIVFPSREQARRRAAGFSPADAAPDWAPATVPAGHSAPSATASSSRALRGISILLYFPGSLALALILNFRRVDSNSN